MFRSIYFRATMASTDRPCVSFVSGIFDMDCAGVSLRFIPSAVSSSVREAPSSVRKAALSGRGGDMDGKKLAKKERGGGWYEHLV